MFRNAAWAQRITLKTDAATAMNLTGVPLRMQIRPNPDSDTILADLSTSNGKIVISDAANGVIDLTLSATDTAAIPKGSHYFDIKRTDTNARLFGGRVAVGQGVTR